MRKTAVLVSIIVLLLVPATALTLNVEVGAITEMDAHFLTYMNETGEVQRLNLSAENTGSIGCQYRLKGVFHYGNTTEIRFSQPHPLWPSATETGELYFMPENYTGEVKAEIHSHFCEQEEFVENITYQQTERNIVNDSVESETISADKEEASVELPVEHGRLLPRETPYYWKASDAEIRNGTATVRYDPPIYNEEENLSYTILDPDNNVVGSTEIVLREEETYWDRLRERLPRILAILLGFSIILNTKLLYHRKRRIEN